MATAAAARTCSAQQQLQQQQLQQLLLQELPISTPAADHSMLSSLDCHWEDHSTAEKQSGVPTLHVGSLCHGNKTNNGGRSSGEALSTLDEDFEANSGCVDACKALEQQQAPPYTQQHRRISPPPLSREELAVTGALSDSFASPSAPAVFSGSNTSRHTRSTRSKRSASSRGDDRSSPVASAVGKHAKRNGVATNVWRGRHAGSLVEFDTSHSQHGHSPLHSHSNGSNSSNNTKDEAWLPHNASMSSSECQADGRCVKSEAQQSHGRGSGVSDNQLRQLGVHFSRYDNSWVARLHVGGKILKKYFSSKLYGFEKAREKALQARRDMELDLVRSQKQQQQQSSAKMLHHHDVSQSYPSPGGKVAPNVSGGEGSSTVAAALCNNSIFGSSGGIVPPAVANCLTSAGGIGGGGDACNGSGTSLTGHGRLPAAAATSGTVEGTGKRENALFHSAAAAAAMMLAQQQVMQQLLLLQMHSAASAAAAGLHQQPSDGGESLIQQAVTAGYALQLEQVQRLQQLQQLQQLHQQQFATTFLLTAAGSLSDACCSSPTTTSAGGSFGTYSAAQSPSLHMGSGCKSRGGSRNSGGCTGVDGQAIALQQSQQQVHRQNQSQIAQQSLPAKQAAVGSIDARCAISSPSLGGVSAHRRDGACSTASTTTTASSLGMADCSKADASTGGGSSSPWSGSGRTGEESPFSAVASLLAAISKRDTGNGSVVSDLEQLGASGTEASLCFAHQKVREARRHRVSPVADTEKDSHARQNENGNDDKDENALQQLRGALAAAESNGEGASSQSIAALAASTLEAELGAVCTADDLQQQLQQQVQQQLQQLLTSDSQERTPGSSTTTTEQPLLLPGLQSLLSSLRASPEAHMDTKVQQHSTWRRSSQTSVEDEHGDGSRTAEMGRRSKKQVQGDSPIDTADDAMSS